MQMAKRLRPDYTDAVTLHALTVTMKLGDYRDVLLALKDAGNVRRKGSAFLQPEGLQPIYRVEGDCLIIDYPVGSPTENRLYFNLKGQGVGNIEDHCLTVNADWFWDGDRMLQVAGTPMDFREETPVGERIRMGFEPLVQKKGYDHVWLLRDETVDPGSVVKQPAEGAETVMDSRLVNGRDSAIGSRLANGRDSTIDSRLADGRDSSIGSRTANGRDSTVDVPGSDGADTAAEVKQGLHYAATLMDRMRTLKMHVYTSCPAIHIYTGNRFSGKEIGKGGCIYPARAGIMLAPCEWPPEGSGSTAGAEAAGTETTGIETAGTESVGTGSIGAGVAGAEAAGTETVGTKRQNGDNDLQIGYHRVVYEFVPTEHA